MVLAPVNVAFFDCVARRLFVNLYIAGNLSTLSRYSRGQKFSNARSSQLEDIILLTDRNVDHGHISDWLELDAFPKTVKNTQ